MPSQPRTLCKPSQARQRGRPNGAIIRAMLSGMAWWRRDCAVFASHPDARPEGAVLLGFSVLDDNGLIRVLEVVQAQGLELELIPDEATQLWIDGLPFAD